MTKNSQSHIETFKLLGNYNDETCETRFVNVSEFVNKFADLKLGNGGGWSRLDGSFGKKYRVCTIKCNGKIIFSPNCSDEDKAKVEKEFSEINFAKKKGNGITFIKIIGIPKTDDKSTRSIRSDIRAHFANKCCVTCGDSNIEIDHKNGEYNNPRVNTTATQTIDDFQALCKHCNDMKRQTYVWQKKNNKRYPATNIPMLLHYGIKYVEGDETYDPKDPNAMVGTYWYDPVEFMKRIFDKSKKEIEKPEIKIEEQEPKIEKPEIKIEEQEPKIEKQEPKIEKQEIKIEEQEPKIEKQEPKIEEPEIKIEKPEIKIEKPEPKIEKQEIKIEKPEPKIEKQKSKNKKPKSQNKNQLKKK